MVPFKDGCRFAKFSRTSIIHLQVENLPGFQVEARFYAVPKKIDSIDAAGHSPDDHLVSRWWTFVDDF